MMSTYVYPAGGILLGYQTTEEDGPYAALYGFPNFGIGLGWEGLSSLRYNGVSRLDDIVNLYGFAERTLLRGRRTSLDFVFDLGLGYNRSLYDPETNPLNRNFSSHLVVFVSSGLSMRVALSERLEAGVSAQFNHYSTGRLAYPNGGLNDPVAYLSLRYRNVKAPRGRGAVRPWKRPRRGSFMKSMPAWACIDAPSNGWPLGRRIHGPCILSGAARTGGIGPICRRGLPWTCSMPRPGSWTGWRSANANSMGTRRSMRTAPTSGSVAGLAWSSISITAISPLSRRSGLCLSAQRLPGPAGKALSEDRPQVCPSRPFRPVRRRRLQGPRLLPRRHDGIDPRGKGGLNQRQPPADGQDAICDFLLCAGTRLFPPIGVVA